MDKKQYEVISPVEHDKKLYRVGMPIELTDDEAGDLLAVQAIRRPQGGQLQSDGDGADLVVDLDLAQGEIARLSALLAARDGEVIDLSRKLDTAEESLIQAGEDIQSLQTAKAAGASTLAELQAQHLETERAKSQLTAEVADLQAKLTAATKTPTKSSK